MVVAYHTSSPCVPSLTTHECHSWAMAHLSTPVSCVDTDSLAEGTPTRKRTSHNLNVYVTTFCISLPQSVFFLGSEVPSSLVLHDACNLSFNIGTLHGCSRPRRLSRSSPQSSITPRQPRRREARLSAICARLALASRLLVR